MEFLSIILFVVGGIILVRHGDKIYRLENELKKMKSSGVVGTQSKSESVIPPVAVSNQPLNVVNLSTVSPPVGYDAPVTVQVPDNKSVQKPIESTHTTSEASIGKVLGIIGIIAIAGSVMFLFSATLIKFVADFAPAIGFVVGIVLLLIGHLTREKYKSYSNTLIGGGIGILYISIFGANSNSYNWISENMAFILLIIVTAFGALLSIIEDALPLAIIATLGGFLSTMIMSDWPNFMTLFLYILILDLGVMVVALFKHWMNLTFVALVCTTFMSFTWTAFSYNPKTDLRGVLFFAIMFFVVFFISNLAHSFLRKDYSSKEDLTLYTVNIGQLAIWLYVLLAEKFDGYLGFIAVILSLITFITAYSLLKVNEKDREMNAYLPGLGVVFLTVAVPLQLDGSWVTVAWLIESVVLMVVFGVVQKTYFRSYSIIVYVIGLLGTLSLLFQGNIGSTIVFNSRFLTGLLAVVVSYCLIYSVKTFVITSDSEDASPSAVSQRSQLIGIFGVVATVLTVWCVTTEIYNYYDAQAKIAIKAYQAENKSQSVYQFNNGYDSNVVKYSNNTSSIITSYTNQAGTTSSIFWALYSLLLIVIGFVVRSKYIRYLGLILFALTIGKVFIQLWQFGVTARVISTMVVGVIALLASFGYAKYKDRLNS